MMFGYQRNMIASVKHAVKTDVYIKSYRKMSDRRRKSSALMKIRCRGFWLQLLIPHWPKCNRMCVSLTKS